MRLRGVVTALVIAFTSGVALTACGGAASSPSTASPRGGRGGRRGGELGGGPRPDAQLPGAEPEPEPVTAAGPAAGRWQPGRPGARAARRAAGQHQPPGPRHRRRHARQLHSALPDDPSDGFETPGFPGIFYVGPGRPAVISSTLG